jgi:hypothetical protein
LEEHGRTGTGGTTGEVALPGYSLHTASGSAACCSPSEMHCNPKNNPFLKVRTIQITFSVLHEFDITGSDWSKLASFDLKSNIRESTER